MPRNSGTGVYEQPAPDVITATTIESAVYNAFVNDVETDLNSPRPVVAGGTGADNATEARDNLDAEVAGMQVANYDSHVWEAGSFWSDIGATGAPDSTHYFMGQCYLATNNVFLEARAMGATPVPQPLWVKHKYNDVWGAWASEGEGYVNTAGDTMTGDLTISKNQPSIFLNKTVAGSQAVLQAQSGGLAVWGILISDGASDNFGIWRYDTGGSPVSPAVIQMTRSPATPAIALNGNVTVSGEFGANTVTATAGVISSTGNVVAQAGNLWAPNGAVIAGPYSLTIGGSGINPANGMGYDGTDLTVRTSTTGGIYLQAQGGSATFASFTAATATLQSTATIVSGTLTVNGNATVSGALAVTGNSVLTGDLTITKNTPTLALNSTGGMPTIDFYISSAVQSSVYDNGAGIIVASDATKTTGMYITHGTSSWAALSDARLPEKVGARPLNMLGRVDQIQVYENEINGKLTLFVLAQEFVKCLPHIIKVGSTDAKHIPTGLDDPDAWGVGYDRAGVAALQLGKEIYDAMRQQIAALTARVEALEAAQATP